MIKNNNPFLSIIIPVYNEQERIVTLPKIAKYLSSMPVSTELVVVNDGSTDFTLAALKKYSRQFPLQIVTYTQNKGKGYALRKGMLRARGQWRLFMDVDLSVPLSTLQRVIKILGKMHTPDIIIGTRRSQRSQVVVRQSAVREALGQVFTKFSKAWLRISFSDFTCGFKCFSAQAAQRVFSRARLHRWGGDVESLFIAHRHALKVYELPVRWKNDVRTKVRFPHDLLRSLWELVLVRYHHWRGRYH